MDGAEETMGKSELNRGSVKVPQPAQFFSGEGQGGIQVVLGEKKMEEKLMVLLVGRSDPPDCERT